MKKSALNWFEIYTNDLDRAKSFYERILNTTLQPASMECSQMAMFPADPVNGVGGALSRMDGMQPGAGGTLVYLNVEGDLDGVLERIPGAGGKVVQSRIDIAPHGFIGIFEDLEGNIVGLHSMT
ncbi:MAG: VOC family protein [Verrucomicrobiota bacterium]